MTINEVRNALVRGLFQFTGRKVVLSDQTLPEAEMPYILYQPTQPYMSRGGANRHVIPQDDETALDIRVEQAEGTFSFTACSCNRETSFGYLYGLDEAQQLADRMHAWFIHAGYSYFLGLGIAIVEVTNVQVRSQLEVDELDRRVGFDVRIRYPLTMTRTDPAIDPSAIRFKQGE